MANNENSCHQCCKCGFFPKFPSMPTGWKFKPTDQELMEMYCIPKTKNLPLQPNEIHNEDIYKDTPEKWKDKYGTVNPEMYFFTSRGKWLPMQNRLVAGHGLWQEVSDTPIFKSDDDNTSPIIGYKKKLVFYTEAFPSNKEETKWVMLEYRVQEKEQDLPKKLDIVLCKIWYDELLTEEDDTDDDGDEQDPEDDQYDDDGEDNDHKDDKDNNGNEDTTTD